MAPTLSEPPSQPNRLRNIPLADLESGWRVYNASHSPVFFFRGPTRFAPLSPEQLGVLYLADTSATAISETFADLVQVPRAALEERALARVSLKRLRLADMTSPGVLRDLGLTPAIWTTTDYGSTQRWATALVGAGFDGMVYMPRHSTVGRMIAVFGPAGSTGQTDDVVTTRRIQDHDINAIGAAIVPDDDDCGSTRTS